MPLATTEYHPQSNDQVEWFKATIISRIHHYVSEHQQNWDSFLTPLTHAYSPQMHSATKLPPFSLVLSRQPSTPGRSTQQRMPHEVYQIDSSKAMRIRLIWRAAELERITDRNLREAQRLYKQENHKKVCFKPTFVTGDYVFVKRPFLTTTAAERLASEN